MVQVQLKPIKEQVVAIVGASSGIGRATALRFASIGARVVVSARSKLGLDSLVEEIKLLGGEASAIVADVAEFEQVKAIADFTVSQYGRLDSWVHLSATGVIAPFDQITPEEFKRIIDVNLMGQVYGAMTALPYLKQEGRGALIHVSSVEGRRSLPLQSPYSSSKHGLEGFLDAMRLELMHENVPVSVTSILPSTINTPYYNKVRTKIGVKPTGVPPYYDPDLVVDAIAYAAEHPIRDFIVGDAGRALDVIHRISPHLSDALLLLLAFPGQHTTEPKSADAPHNVFEPIEGYNRIEGDFNNLEIPSVTDWWEMNPAAKWSAIAGTAAGAIALVFAAAEAFKNGKFI